jgi:hypothetical protein
MPITYADAERTLTACGFTRCHETSKVKGFALRSKTVYLKKPRAGRDGVARPVVVNPSDARDFEMLMSINGVERSKGRSEYYHNANMKAFERRLNGGIRPTRYGYDFDFADTATLSTFLRAIG